jgi:hypothetical protein
MKGEQRFVRRLVAFFIYLAFSKKAVALDCYRALILGSAGDADAVEWVSQHCATTNTVDATPPTVDLIDALCSSQVIIADESDALLALVALCPYELVLLLSHRHNLGQREDDSTAVELGYTPCDIDAVNALKCYRLTHGRDPSFKKAILVEAVLPAVAGITTSAASSSGFELGMLLAPRLSLSVAGWEAYALELAVRVRIDATTERHTVVPRASFGSLGTLRVFIEVRRAKRALSTPQNTFNFLAPIASVCRLSTASMLLNWSSGCSTTKGLNLFPFLGKAASPLWSLWRRPRHPPLWSPPLASGPPPCRPERCAPLLAESVPFV